MRIRNKILLVSLVVLPSIVLIIISIWYSNSKKLSDTYLSNISESTMQDAYHAFEYLLTDTAYMSALISSNTGTIMDFIRSMNN